MTLGAFTLVGCRSDGEAGAKVTGSDSVADAGLDAGTGSGQPAFCARPGSDAVRTAFCTDPPPGIESLHDLQTLVGLGFDLPSATDYDASNTYGGGLSVVLLDLSTALGGDLVSPINPRVIVLGGSSIVAFQRGAQQVELASVDVGTGLFNFYLVTFAQACNGAPAGCVPGDLFTPRIEAGWKSVAIHDAEDLKNTPSDCRQCHQRGTERPALLMRELEGPWTHFFGPNQAQRTEYPEASGIDLIQDFRKAKGDETYGGVPANVLSATAGISLQVAVGFPQPLVFDGPTILNERWPYGPTGYATVPRRSLTWYAGFDAFRRGEQLPLPHFDPRPTDAAKQAALTAAYQRVAANEVPAEQLPDLRDIYPDDPQVRAEVGLQTEPGANAVETLIEACGSCHNDVLDQSLSRARFNVALPRMSRGELDLALQRIRAPHASAGAMPPAGARKLDPGGLTALVAYLEADVRTADEDALLLHAASAGMAGPAAVLPDAGADGAAGAVPGDAGAD